MSLIILFIKKADFESFKFESVHSNFECLYCRLSVYTQTVSVYTQGLSVHIKN
jgi:hypothetical protein